MKLIHRILISNKRLGLALLLLCSIAAPLSAAMFTVITTADNGDNISPIPGSLRAAIISSNSTVGPNTITFNFGTALPPFVIQPTTNELPPISNTVTIDGYLGSPGGATPNGRLQGDNAMLTVVINGSKYTVGDGQFTGNGLHFVAGSDGSVVKGLVINEWLLNGILIDGSNGPINGIQIVGNFIGTNVSGNAVDANRTGIGLSALNVSGALNPITNTVIGTANPADRNILAGSFGYCIFDAYSVRGACVCSYANSGTLIQNNYIGTDTSGSIALGNSHCGVMFLQETASTIGGTSDNQRNIISGHSIYGINLTSLFLTLYVYQPGNTLCVIQGNYIGTDVTGTVALGNSNAGLELDSSSTNNTIGGSVAGAGNLISGNGNGPIPGSGFGIYLGQFSIPGSIHNLVQGNKIGTDVSGSKALPNTGFGIVVNDNQNTIGGSTMLERNIISGNGGGGILMYGANADIVTGNLIGTDFTGINKIPNGGNGIQLGTNGTIFCEAINNTVGI